MTRPDLRDIDPLALAQPYVGALRRQAAQLAAQIAPDKLIAWRIDQLVASLPGIAVADVMLDIRHRRDRALPAGEPVPPGASLGARLLAMASGRYAAPREIWRKPDRPDLAAFIVAAGLPWRMLAPAPSSPLGGDNVLVYLLDGADPRSLRACLAPDVKGVVLHPQGQSPVRLLAGAYPGLAARPYEQRPAGFGPDWYGDARRLAEHFIAALGAEFAPGELAGAVERHGVMLANRLNFDLIREIAAAQQLRARIAESACDSVLIVQGARAADHLAAATISVGIAPERVFETCATYRPTARLAFALRRGATTAADSGPSLARHEQILAGQIAQYRQQVREPNLAGKVIVTADFRNRRDFRYLTAARPLVTTLAGKRRVAVLQQRNAISLRLLQTAAALWRLKPGRVAVHLRRSPYAFPPSTTIAPASRRMGELARAQFLAEPGRLSPELAPTVQQAVAGFAQEFFCQGLALALQFEQGLRRKPPIGAVLIPETQPFPMILASAARAAGARTLGVQTLMLGQSERDCRPIAEFIGCLDTTQRDLYHRRFGIPMDNVVLIGSEELTSWQIATAANGDARKPDSRKRVVFVSQPVPVLVDAALRWVAAAVRARPDVELLVYLHPDETDADMARYRAILADGAAEPRLRIAGRGTSLDAVASADVIAGVVSNVGYKAALIGKPVLAVDPTTIGLPIRFDEMGLALGAASQQEVADKLDALLDRGELFNELTRRRDAFIAANPQLVDGRAVDRIADLVAGWVARQGNSDGH